MPPIYLDYNATTPLDPRVLEVMGPFFSERFGNPSSTHLHGHDANTVLDVARADVASLVDADPDEVVFTSGATESNNLAIRGIAEAKHQTHDHMVCSAIEHASVLAVMDYLKSKGWRITVLPVTRDGFVEPRSLRAVLDREPRTALVSVMTANNEIGTVQPVKEISDICRERGVAFHTDACQGFGRVALKVCGVGGPCAPAADMISLSGHKLYGPKGIGALIVRKGSTVTPQTLGGTHEHGMRAGTPNVPGIVGLGVACSIMREEWPAESDRLRKLRDCLLGYLRASLGDRIVVNGAMGDDTVRLPHNLNVTILGIDPEKFALGVEGHISISGSSACSSGLKPKTSKIIEAIGGHSVEEGATARIGLGRHTTLADVQRAAKVISETSKRLW